MHHQRLPDSVGPTNRYTTHAMLRQNQRNFTDADLDYVLRYGESSRRTGVTFTFLRRRDIDAEDRDQERIARLEGTVIIVADDQTVITVYRNRRALRHIARKHKHRRARRHSEAMGRSECAGASHYRRLTTDFTAQCWDDHC